MAIATVATCLNSCRRMCTGVDLDMFFAPSLKFGDKADLRAKIWTEWKIRSSFQKLQELFTPLLSPKSLTSPNEALESNGPPT